LGRQFFPCNRPSLLPPYLFRFYNTAKRNINLFAVSGKSEKAFGLKKTTFPEKILGVNPGDF
jgi:hypothetical protein